MPHQNVAMRPGADADSGARSSGLEDGCGRGFVRFFGLYLAADPVRFVPEFHQALLEFGNRKGSQILAQRHRFGRSRFLFIPVHDLLPIGPHAAAEVWHELPLVSIAGLGHVKRTAGSRPQE